MPYNCRSTREYTNKKIAVAFLSETATAILHYLKFAMIDSQLLITTTSVLTVGCLYLDRNIPSTFNTLFLYKICYRIREACAM